jgi:hypothetical protein
MPASSSKPVESERFRLARLARAAALAVPGVLDAAAGPGGLFVTVERDERVEGVLCAATHEGGYEVTLRLICELVPLLELSERVSAAVGHAATVARLPLDGVHVHVAAVDERRYA